MAWHARLNLDYRAEPATGGTRADFRHDGPLRVLAPRVEPVHDLLASVWRAWRALAWEREACVPRVWRT